MGALAIVKNYQFLEYAAHKKAGPHPRGVKPRGLKARDRGREVLTRGTWDGLSALQ